TKLVLRTAKAIVQTEPDDVELVGRGPADTADIHVLGFQAPIRSKTVFDSKSGCDANAATVAGTGAADGRVGAASLNVGSHQRDAAGAIEEPILLDPADSYPERANRRDR